MPHISKQLLEKEKFGEIHKQLLKVVSALSRTGQARIIFNELLTKTEKLMLAKRLAIIVMLDQGESIYGIENTLKVSPSTAARMSLSHESGEYSELLKEIKKQNSFWTQLEKSNSSASR